MTGVLIKQEIGTETGREGGQSEEPQAEMATYKPKTGLDGLGPHLTSDF